MTSMFILKYVRVYNKQTQHVANTKISLFGARPSYCFCICL